MCSTPTFKISGSGTSTLFATFHSVMRSGEVIWSISASSSTTYGMGVSTTGSKVRCCTHSTVSSATCGMGTSSNLLPTVRDSHIDAPFDVSLRFVLLGSDLVHRHLVFNILWYREKHDLLNVFVDGGKQKRGDFLSRASRRASERAG